MRRATEGGLIVVLLVLLAGTALWVVNQTAERGEHYPPMTTYSPEADGTMALYELCESLGYSVSRFHDTVYDYPLDTAMVVLDKPDTTSSLLMGGALDVRQLRLWLADGGRLLLVSDPLRSLGTELFAEIDRAQGLEPRGGPVAEWSGSPDRPVTPLTELDGLDQAGDGPAEQDIFRAPTELVATYQSSSGESGSQMALWRMYENGRCYRMPPGRPARWTGIEMIETAAPDFLPYVHGEVLLATREPLEPLVLYRRVGRGEVLWLTRSEVVTNKWLGRVDNHRLLLALVDQLAVDKRLAVDESIHGYVKPGANIVSMLTSTRGGQLLLALTGVAVLFFLGAAVRPARFHPQPVPPRRQATEMVLAQADLYRRAGRPGLAADNLVSGVRRMLWQQEQGIPAGAARGGSFTDLLAQLERRPGARARHCAQLLTWLQEEHSLGPRELLQLARACDSVRAEIEGTDYSGQWVQ
ncbi:DUF4350 domain-containing protein [bacterium]|nr:DUF4350 domain-containing protein [bacterium]